MSYLPNIYHVNMSICFALLSLILPCLTSKPNVSNPHSVGMAGLHRDEGGIGVFLTLPNTFSRVAKFAKMLFLISRHLPPLDAKAQRFRPQGRPWKLHQVETTVL
jgi:hypothetical protein